MASTTTNLGLMKPAYSDDADISDINGNMDLIDAEAGRVRANVAANYDSSETYAVGDYCLHDGSLYKCSTAISSPEAWTAGHWTQIKITGELSALNGNLQSITTGPNVPSDLNNINKTSMCYTNDTSLNRPGDWCIVYTFAYEENTIAQLAFQISDDVIFYRRYSNGWHAWKKVTLTAV
jgi:hypothetical protein